MAKGENQHAVKHPDGWAVKGAGNSRATKVTQTQVEAVEVVENIVRNNSQTPRFMVWAEKSGRGTVMATIHVRQRIKNRGVHG